VLDLRGIVEDSISIELQKLLSHIWKLLGYYG